jgi:hypothetical protein
LSTRPAPSFAKPRADVASMIRLAAQSYREETKGKQAAPAAEARAWTPQGSQ